MTIEFLEPAEAEFNDAIDYYNRISPGLGFEFALEGKKTLTRLLFLRFNNLITGWNNIRLA